MRSPAADAPTASDIGRALDLDAGYLSRVLRNFEKRGLIVRKASASDARQSHLTLSARGRKAFAPLEHRSQRDTGAMLGKLHAADQARLIAAMSTIETLLGGDADSRRRAAGRRYILRAPVPRRFRLDRQTPRRALRAGIRLDRAVRRPVRADRRRLRQQ